MADDTPAVEPPENAVYTDELARLAGIKPASVKHYTAQARKGWPGGRVRPGWPLPKGKVLRDVPSPNTPNQPTRRVWVPWWDRAEVDAFLAEFPVAPGRRGRAEQEE